MYIEKIDYENKELLVAILLTTASGKTRVKQRAIGIQPMLYFCFPITELISPKSLIGRIADKKEFAYFKFDKNNANIILEMIKIFGMLSVSHKFDILKIMDLIITK